MGSNSSIRGIVTIVLLNLTLLQAHREHKVHNIVLYPDKHSWCKTTPIKQVVTWPQCSSQELDNNVCVGACFSYMVPHSEPSAPGDLIRPYCDSCQPLDSVWHTVSFKNLYREIVYSKIIGKISLKFFVIIIRKFNVKKY